MRVYEAVFDEDKTDGVYGISLVENPAMEDHWITLSEQPTQINFSAVNDEKKLLLGAVLIPNKKVLRIDGEGNEFFITFTKETVGKLAHNFLKKGFQNNSSLEHEIKLNDVSFVESWQVENPEIDKSALYGKKYEEGTWVTMAKVSDENYEKAKNGELKGFSIDGLLGLKKIELNQVNNNSMTKQDFLDAFKAIFSQEPEKVAENVEVKAEEVIEETVEDTVETKPEVQEFDKEAFMDAVAEVMKTQLSKFDEKLEAIEAKFSKELEEKENEVKELETKLSKEPEVKGIKPNPEKANPSIVRYGQNAPRTQLDTVLDMMFKN